MSPYQKILIDEFFMTTANLVQPTDKVFKHYSTHLIAGIMFWWSC